jgi:adenosylmethionine-8-amino-7-oxononanoate aminotransferase
LLFEVEPLPFPHTWNDDDDVEQKEAAALEVLEQALAQPGESVAALIMEPLVQGASGMRMCRPGFVRAVAERVQEAGALLIFDEVMTGFGRTGHLFACLGLDVTPDLICLSKGLTGGFLPLSVTVARESVYQAFLAEDFERAFIHGHSFTANPLGCAAALASLELTTSESTRQRIRAIESKHRNELNELSGHPRVRHARQTGTIAAFNISGGGEGYSAAVGQRLKAEFLGRGLLLRPLGDVLYLLPPYCLDPEELGRAYGEIALVLDGLD